MSGKLHFNLTERYDFLYALLVALSVLLWLATALVTSHLVIDKGVVVYFFVGVGIFLFFDAISILNLNHFLLRTSRVFLLIGALFFLMLSIPDISLMIISVAMIAVLGRMILLRNGNKNMPIETLASVLAIIFMVLLGALIRYSISPP
ncbi:MAG: hypothetical protein QW812_00280, partial [Thermoplasmataceae archaeon]